MATNWKLFVNRLGQHRKGGRVRTYGSYEVFVDRVAIPNLSGFVLEAPGPGSNGLDGKNRLRIEEGEYQLRAHASARYKSSDYDSDPNLLAVHPLPSIEIFRADMGVRKDVLIHPGHPFEPERPPSEPLSDLFLSSIGCLNLTGPLRHDEDMVYADSRQRMLALLGSLISFAGGSLPSIAGGQTVPHAALIIQGEPTHELD